LGFDFLQPATRASISARIPSDLMASLPNASRS
jgi:hypothetical protein